MKKTLVPAILVIAIAVGCWFVWQTNMQITKLNNTVTGLVEGILPTVNCQVIGQDGKPFSTTTPALNCIDYNFQIQANTIKKLSTATTTKK